MSTRRRKKVVRVRSDLLEEGKLLRSPVTHAKHEAGEQLDLLIKGELVRLGLPPTRAGAFRQR